MFLLSSLKNYSAFVLTLWWIFGKMEAKLYLYYLEIISWGILWMKWLATSARASVGHLSMMKTVQQDNRDGKLRHLSLKLFPIGDIPRIVWKLLFNYSVNVISIPAWVDWSFYLIVIYLDISLWNRDEYDLNKIVH